MPRSAARILSLSLLALSACTGPAASAAGPVATDHIDMPKSYLFRPADITVKAGTTVTITNSDNFTHSFRILEGPAGQGTVKVVQPGESTTYTFTVPGLYRYDCSFHPQNMHGTVTVTAP